MPGATPSIGDKLDAIYCALYTNGTGTGGEMYSGVWSGGVEYNSIQAAIDAAPSGGTVTVSPGTYAEALSITKPLTLYFLPGAVLTPGLTSAVIGISTAGNVLIQGFRFIGAANEGGIVTNTASLTMSDFHINTSANNTTSPITVNSGVPVLRNGALVAEGSSPSIATSMNPATVKVYGVIVANELPAGTVTVQVGSITVDANVT